MSARYGQKEAHEVMRDVHRALAAELRQATGADSAGVRAAAGVLRREIKRTLSTPGRPRYFEVKTRRPRGGTPSPEGQPPAMQSGRLARSVGSKVVDGARRVGFSNFRARILQFGAVQAAEPPRPSRRKGAKPGTMTRAKRAIVIKPRPFMERSLAAAQPKMEEALAGELQKLGGTR